LSAAAPKARRWITPEAGVAQLAEQLIRNQQVIGSSPIAGSNQINHLQELGQGLAKPG
jgi:hypothetical protein